jgi:mannosylglycerate hydrolase
VTGEARTPPLRVIHLVPHTHWDREWYLPFQTFRARLVGLIDGLLDEMDRDPSVCFTLDGQTATVDDYLEIRPEAEGRLARLIRDGRLALGPWAILMDEFLVSGETIVRNLEVGWQRAQALGGVMAVGYLPDMFGHVAQMPQILARAGIGDAVVWRGVPMAIDGHVFTWKAPDGSEVRCEYLCRGYGQAHDLFDLDDRIGRKLDVYQSVMEPFFGHDETLAMYGEDHSLPMPGYAAAIAHFNASQDRYDVRIETLATYIEATRDRSRATRTWTGELRSGARANILAGVASHRIEVKQAAARAERWLERRAEPLLALHGLDWPARELEIAWRRVIEDSAHDSVCACSCEATVQQVLTRYAEAEQIGQALVEETLDEIGAHAPAGSWVVWNPSPRDRTDIVEISMPADAPLGVVAADGTAVAIQSLSVDRAVLDDRTMPAGDVVPYLRNRLHARELYGSVVNGLALGPGDRDGVDATVTIDVADVADPAVLDLDELLDGLSLAVGTAESGGHDATWRLRVVPRPQRHLLVRADVAGLGVTTLVPRGREGRAGAADAPAVPHAVVSVEGGLSNGLVSIAVREDGTLIIAGSGVTLAGVGRITDGGDVGDAYNYAPPARDTLVVDPVRCRVETLETGPLRGILRVTRWYAWPGGLDDGSRCPETIETEVVLDAELRADEAFVRLRVDIDNGSLDHRVRFHVPLPARADRSFAEGQYAIVERGLTVEGGHGEHPLATFPAHGLVAAEGAVVLLDHLTEYELVDGDELALTLLRSTGLISRDVHPWRAEPAGPVIAAPGGQGLGRRSTTFAVLPHAGPPGPVALDALERFRNEFVARWAAGGGDASGPARSLPGLTVEGEAVVLTSLRRRGVALELRLVNESDATRPAQIRGPFASVEVVDLLGRPIGDAVPAEGGRHDLVLDPWEIRTMRLAP